MIRDERGSVALVIKFIMSGVFLCPCLLWISIEDFLRTYACILVITYYEPETIIRDKHVINRIMYFFHNNFFLVCNIIMW